MIVLPTEETKATSSNVGGETKIIVLDDNVNTFDYVAFTLSKVLPGVTVEAGYGFADVIHNTGLAIVWTGLKEIAELYHDQLTSAGLTMAPLEN